MNRIFSRFSDETAKTATACRRKVLESSLDGATILDRHRNLITEGSKYRRFYSAKRIEDTRFHPETGYKKIQKIL